MDLIKTSVGLPNTCTICGKPMADEWFAPNEDAARSGLGGHKTCLSQDALKDEPKAAPKARAKPAAKETDK